MIDLEKEIEEFIKVYTEIYGEHDQIWQGWKKRAELAHQEISELKAKLAKYERDDVVVVPREPNNDMMEGAYHVLRYEEACSYDIYKAMIKAGEIK